MGSNNISKIERVQAPQGGSLGTDLYLNKEEGFFFADVGNERVLADTKAEAIEKTREALTRVAQTAWREVIVIQAPKQRRDESDLFSWHNNMPVFGASCSFHYFRRERAQDPLKSRQTIEREHSADFEVRIKAARRDVHGWTPEEKRKRADDKEKQMRETRARLGDVHKVYVSDNDVEYEMPYSDEAWAGIERIAKTIRETQERLDAFSKQATPKLLARIASLDVFTALPPAPSKEKK